MPRDANLDLSNIVEGRRERKRKRTVTPPPPPVDSHPKPGASVDPPDIVQQYAKQIIQALKDEANAYLFFRLPSKRQFPDYYEIIKRPICIDDILVKANRMEYLSIDAIAHDIDQMFNNAKRYNMKESQIYIDAVRLHKMCRQMIASFLQKDDKEREIDSHDHKAKKLKLTKKISPPLEEIEEELINELRIIEEGKVRIAEVFEELPDKSAYPEYYQIIKEPMALNVISKKIKKKVYPSFKEFDADIHRVFENAMTFNEDGSQIFLDAQTLLRLYEEFKKKRGIQVEKQPKLHVNGPTPKIKLRVKDEDESQTLQPIKIRITTNARGGADSNAETSRINENGKSEYGILKNEDEEERDSHGLESVDGGDGDYDGTEDDEDDDQDQEINIVSTSDETKKLLQSSQSMTIPVSLEMPPFVPSNPLPSYATPSPQLPQMPRRPGRPPLSSYKNYAPPPRSQPQPVQYPTSHMSMYRPNAYRPFIPSHSVTNPPQLPAPPQISLPVTPVVLKPVKPTPPLIEHLVLYSESASFAVELFTGAFNKIWDSTPHHAVFVPTHGKSEEDSLEVNFFILPSERGKSARGDRVFHYKVILNGHLLDPPSSLGDPSESPFDAVSRLKDRDDTDFYSCKIKKGFNSIEIQATAPRVPLSEEEEENKEKQRHTRRNSPISNVETQTYLVFVTCI